jgi:hypothetical protein
MWEKERSSKCSRPDYWLTSTDIFLALLLLHRQFSDNRERPLIQSGLLGYSGEKLSIGRRFFQHYHVQQHWVLVDLDPNGSPHAIIYDSMSQESHRQVEQAISQDLDIPVSDLEVEWARCSQQADGNICGVHTVANAVEISYYGRSGVEFTHSAMRAHLVQCMEQDCFTPFPAEDGN